MESQQAYQIEGAKQQPEKILNISIKLVPIKFIWLSCTVWECVFELLIVLLPFVFCNIKKTYSRMQKSDASFCERCYWSWTSDKAKFIQRTKNFKTRTFLIRKKKSNRFPCQNCKSCCKSEGAHTAHTFADILNLNNKISLNLFLVAIN